MRKSLGECKMGTLMDYMDAHALLGKYGIKALDAAYVGSAKEAVGFAKGRTIVMKLISDKALHKSKSGLVKLSLSGDAKIEGAYSELVKLGEKLKPYKILVQEQVSNGTEIIIGGNTDPQFGKLILLGLGGIYVEVFKDVSVRLCPITEYDANAMIESLKSKQIMLADERNGKIVKNLLLKVSEFLVKNQKITELDLNPIILHDGTYDAVDLRLIGE
jgi:acetyl-CoA synthetase (ADP-forming)